MKTKTLNVKIMTKRLADTLAKEAAIRGKKHCRQTWADEGRKEQIGGWFDKRTRARLMPTASISAVSMFGA
jgi:hypothetical protein